MEEDTVGYFLTREAFDGVVAELGKRFRIFAPVRKKGAGRFTDTDVILYDTVRSGSEIVLDAKSDYAFKEALTPLSEVLFYFTEANTQAASFDDRPILIFARACDMHALQRMDQIYLCNGPEDPFYRRRRELVHFALIGCSESFPNCFCVSMGTNVAPEGWLFSVDSAPDGCACTVPDAGCAPLFAAATAREIDAAPCHVTENEVRVCVPETVPAAVRTHSLWDEYTVRCINCGRCNFVCPTCTCWSMQDISYTDNGNVGERRRVAASCMVDGFTDVAGGGQYRRKNGERMRFKVLHKIYDHRQRFGNDMCVGCGRCDDICPEYISYSNIINKVYDAAREG